MPRKRRNVKINASPTPVAPSDHNRWRYTDVTFRAWRHARFDFALSGSLLTFFLAALEPS